MPLIFFIPAAIAVHKEAQVLPDATPASDGVMTAAQAAKLANIPASSGGAYYGYVPQAEEPQPTDFSSYTCFFTSALKNDANVYAWKKVTLT